MNPMSIVSSLVAEAPRGGTPLAASLLVIGFGFLFGMRLARRARRLRPVGERVLILGGSALARRVLEEIEREPSPRHAVVGVVDHAENLRSVIDATRPDRIVVGLAERRGRLPLCRLVESRARGILVEDVAETYERLTGKLALEAVTPSSVIFSCAFAPSRLQRALARALSLLVSVVGLVALAPVLGLIALLVKLDSRGPVFFVQERVGLAGRPFSLIKFRSMHPTNRPKSEWEQDNRDRRAVPEPIVGKCHAVDVRADDLR